MLFLQRYDYFLTCDNKIIKSNDFYIFLTPKGDALEPYPLRIRSDCSTVV